MKRIRCAIYTRKSSDEGLEQDFNSLDAQFEACSAYILSQASEGWNGVSTRYDDGGVSGGTLERPALKPLLNDIASGLIDTVVVYKIDRLTRSLLDFAKLVEAFDKAETSFVSITQSFNTTTSMCRLTLNMLLSFAQFEREVTAERIRDKISASKAKGMWMGGTPPLGYAANGRSLKIVDEHAGLIREIYRRYLKLGSVRLLEEQLQADGISVPARTAGTGKMTGGGKFLRGQLYTILDNPIYKREIKHGKKTYPNLHQAIIDPGTWEYVQLKRQDNVRSHRSQYLASHQSLLAGKLFDEAGKPLIAVHANKGPKRYRYYVSQHLHHKTNCRCAGITSASSLGSAPPAKSRTLPRKMAAEKMGLFGPTSLSNNVLLVQYRSLRGSELGHLRDGSLKLPKTADCMAVGTVACETLSVCISLLCREFTGKHSYIRCKFYVSVLLKPAILRHAEPNSLLFETANFIAVIRGSLKPSRELKVMQKVPSVFFQQYTVKTRTLGRKMLLPLRLT